MGTFVRIVFLMMVALVVLGFLLKPAGSSWSYGVFLALAASVVAFLPFGLPIIEARRRH